MMLAEAEDRLWDGGSSVGYKYVQPSELITNGSQGGGDVGSLLKVDPGHHRAGIHLAQETLDLAGRSKIALVTDDDAVARPTKGQRGGAANAA
jgi:hypothetical protein